MIETITIPSLDPLLIFSLVVMNIGAKFLDIKLTDFQQKLIKNHIVQALILFSMVYIGTRDILKSIIIVAMIYLLIYVLLNENHQFNIYSKKLLLVGVPGNTIVLDQLVDLFVISNISSI